MLTLSNVTKKFDGKLILENFSYTFDKGIYLVHGESGVGKTTLLRMIAGLDNDYEGEILGGGCANVSMAFQEYRLFPNLNALDNVLLAFKLPNEAAIARATDILNSLGISDEDMLLFPSEMSGGMKLRASLARAIVKDSPILLLDEPTRELNRELIEGVISILCDEAKERIVIIVTHDDIDELFEQKVVINLNN